MIPDLIVSRHRGALEWLAGRLGNELEHGEYVPGENVFRVYPVADTGHDFPPYDVPVRAEVGPDDVRDKVVVGNLPLHLAALCRRVVAVEFGGPPPRGAEYGPAEMEAAGGRLASYTVARA